jgi:hypothetical protein
MNKQQQNRFDKLWNSVIESKNMEEFEINWDNLINRDAKEKVEKSIIAKWQNAGMLAGLKGKEKRDTAMALEYGTLSL